MSKKLNLPSALGIFLIGISFLPSVAKAQVVNGRTNAYWDVNGTTTGEGGAGTWSSSSVFWTTNAVNATAATGGPTGGGLFSVTSGAPDTATINNSGGYYFNFTGTSGSVAMGGSMIVSGLNFATDGYTLTTTSGLRNITGTNAIVGSVTNQAAVSLGNNVNLALSSLNAAPATASLTLSTMNIVGGTGSSLTLGTGASSVTNSVFGSGVTIDSTAPIRVNIGSGSKFYFGSQSSSGLTVNANITNSSASGVALDITNSASGTVALNGVVSGANGLVLNNSSSGKILLSAANTYSGGTTLNNSGTGIITFSNAAAFGTGTITSAGAITNYVRSEGTGLDVANNWQIDNGSTLRLNANSGSVTASGVIAGAGSMMFSNSGISYYLTGINNSFGGGVSVGNGTLYFNKFGSNGLNSSLGTSGTITVGGPSATTTGGLRWIGTTNETSDKTIVLAGTTGGLSLLANGATNASLTLSGNINSTGVGSKTLTFGGYNTNTLTLNGVINENGGVNSVVIGTSSSGTVVLGNANNSFSGAITVTNATSGQYTYLSTANIGNAGQNSALGKNGTINIGSSSSTAFTTLRYTGTGEISDKVINLAGTTGGAILDQSGTGNLKFTSAMTATGVGAKAITLQGATAGTGELAGAISDLGGNVISLNKYGSGDWILSGNNSYTGATTVSGGTLTLSGGNSAASGGVTVTAGTLNVNSANALGSGTLTLTVDSRLNNTSGSAVVNSGNNAVVWGNSTSGAFTVGTAGSTSSNNLDLGTGTVTASASRSLTLLGTGTTFKMGTLENTSASDGRTFTFDGEGDNMILRGFKISTGSIAAVTNSLAGSANLEITGAIENGNSFANGVTIKSTGTTTFSGANTYTGGTEITGGATLRYGASDVTENTGGEMYVNGGTLNLQSYNDTVSSVRVSTGGTIAGSGTLTATSFTLSGNNTIDANLAGATATLSKSTSGSLSLLNGNNTYGGTTTVSSGTLRLGSNTALGSTVGGTTVSSGGLLDLNGKTVGAEGFTFTGTGGLLNSSASSASLSGNLEVGAGMTVNTTGDITLSGQLTGISSRNLTKSGAGTLRVTAANSTFAGTNTVSAGTLLVDTGANVSTSASIVNGGLLKVNGTAGGVTVNTGGSLGGSGSVGAVTLTSGSFLKPGNSPGLLTAASSSWASGSTYEWQIDNATGTAGTNWDVFSVTGALDLSALSSTGQMNLVLESLSIANYSTSTSYTWVIAKADSFTGVGAGVTDLTSLFNINSTAFNGGAAANLPNGGFQVVTGTEGSLRTLNLMAIPEPSTGSMLGLGLAGLFATRLLRRKSS